MDVELLAAGAVVGAVTGAAGMGGGTIGTPLLVLAFGVPPSVAVSASVAANAAMKSVAAAVHARRRTVDWRLVYLLAAGSAPGAFFGALLAHAVRDADTVIRGALGAVLLASSALQAAKPWIGRRLAGIGPEGIGPASPRSSLQPVLLGLAVGLAVAVTSVGSGSIMGALLTLAVPALGARRIVGTTLAQAVPLLLAATAGAALFGGGLHLALTGALIAGAVPGAWLGARVSSRAPEGAVRAVLVVVLALCGSKLLGMW